MLDDNWETINGPIAHEIEVLNATNQINVLDGLVAFLLAHRGSNPNIRAPMPDETSLCYLHHAGTLFLLSEPGTYRNIEVHTEDEAGNRVYQAPPWQDVNGLMKQFFRHLSSIWTSGDALDVAAFALWRINWIHPFRNGNGRTARAFSYACLSLHIGAVLPGTITVIDQIMQNRGPYQQALKAADAAVAAGSFKLDEMKAFLNELLQKQMASADEASAPQKA
jgi:Fic family protein